MVATCLIVHECSVPCVRNVLAALIEALQDTFEQECRMVVCSSVDSAEIRDAELIFVIGENLGRFKRLAGRRYIYLNFSVVAMLGNPFQFSIKGIRLIRYKNRLLRRKLDLLDALLDYYPPQTRRLVQTLNIPVAGFVPWISPPCRRNTRLLSQTDYTTYVLLAASAQGDNGCLKNCELQVA